MAEIPAIPDPSSESKSPWVRPAAVERSLASFALNLGEDGDDGEQIGSVCC